jgi:lysophospholipase L1-like esterase
VAVQGAATRRRVPRLPPASPPHEGLVPGVGVCIKLLAIGESPVAGVGVAGSDEAIAAATARALARLTGRPVAWRAEGLSGVTAKEAIERLLPRIAAEPADLLVIAFGVNDTIAYRSPRAFAGDLAALVAAARDHVGDAAVIIAGVPPFASIPAFPWPLRTILNWRAAALQAAADLLPERLSRVTVLRFPASLGPDLFAADGFHPSPKAHELWGEGIAEAAARILAPGVAERA